MSRVVYGLKNTKMSLFFNLVLLLLTFFSRRVFIDSLGVEIMGLSTSMLNILLILNLSELGVGTAVSTSLYAPLAQANRQKIDDILSIMAYLYRIIGFIIIGIGAIILISLPHLYSDGDVSMGWVYATFAALFVSNLVPFFISYQQVILDADQRYYEIAAATNTLVFIKVVIQMICLKFFSMAYASWLILEVIFAFILGIWLVYRVRKLYPWLNSSFSKGRRVHKQYQDILRRARQVIPHRISTAVLNQTDNILLLMLVSLSSVTLYTNYALVTKKCVMLISATFNGLTAGVGNLIAQGNIDSVRKLFWEFNALFFILGSTAATGIYLLIDSFVSLWLGPEFVLSRWVTILISVNTFLTIMRLPLTYFTNGYGLFKDVWAPFAEATINLVGSIILGYVYGIEGVLAGSAISLLFIAVWKPYFFYREIFKSSVFSYWRNIAFGIVMFTLNLLILELGVMRVLGVVSDGFLGWTLNAIIVSIVSIIVISSGMFIGFQGTKDISKRAISVLLPKR